MNEIKLYEMLGRQLVEIEWLRSEVARIKDELNAIKRELNGFAGEPDDCHAPRGLLSNANMALSKRVEELRASLRKFEGIAAERDEALFQLEGLREKLDAEGRHQ